MKEIKMPNLGESVKESTILFWTKREGEFIEKEKVLLEVDASKANIEISSPFSGHLNKILAKEGEVVKFNQVIALIDETKDNKIKKIKSDKFFSPLIKNLIKKESITQEEIELIKGSGANNRIQKKDIYQYLKTKNKNNKMSKARKAIADHMIFSKKTSAHVTCFSEADLTDLVYLKNNIPLKMTFTPFFIKSVADSLVDFPFINASIVDSNIVIHDKINIGVALATNDKLIVPVIRDANKKDLKQINLELEEIKNQAKNNKIKPDTLSGGTFTISNVGTFGSLMGTPIINQPELGIIAFGVIKKRPEVVETNMGDSIAIRSIMHVSFSFDHRAIDGLLAGKFVNCVVNKLQDVSFWNSQNL